MRAQIDCSLAHASLSASDHLVAAKNASHLFLYDAVILSALNPDNSIASKMSSSLGTSSAGTRRNTSNRHRLSYSPSAASYHSCESLPAEAFSHAGSSSDVSEVSTHSSSKIPGGASNYGRTSTSTSMQTVVMPVLASPHIIHPQNPSAKDTFTQTVCPELCPRLVRSVAARVGHEVAYRA